SASARPQSSSSSIRFDTTSTSLVASFGLVPTRLPASRPPGQRGGRRRVSPHRPKHAGKRLRGKEIRRSSPPFGRNRRGDVDATPRPLHPFSTLATARRDDGADKKIKANEQTEERLMRWTKPRVEEICVGLEINGYFPPEY
ncbi:MAG: pyrroloquinoline quinone precursor peptide PqqA, partial [Phyllobacteriaceae bacterium]|nr:pyrroloquinoline quinone precursor peptide PqqA [Phyllobacteriaceae bacterium]